MLSNFIVKLGQIENILIFSSLFFFFFGPLKTHSAYMLFYKRMEPEEENGKEFKFDVSSELLEV